MKGLVVRNTGYSYSVKDDETGRVYECKVKGNFRIKGIRTTNPVAIGDRVEFTPQQEENAGLITAVADRKNYIIRKSANLSKQSHILAANVDQCFLIVTVRQPETSLTFVDRFLASAEAYRVPVTIVFNKIDLVREEGQRSKDEGQRSKDEETQKDVSKNPAEPQAKDETAEVKKPKTRKRVYNPVIRTVKDKKREDAKALKAKKKADAKAEKERKAKEKAEAKAKKAQEKAEAKAKKAKEKAEAKAKKDREKADAEDEKARDKAEKAADKAEAKADKALEKAEKEEAKKKKKKN